MHKEVTYITVASQDSLADVSYSLASTSHEGRMMLLSVRAAVRVCESVKGTATRSTSIM